MTIKVYKTTIIGKLPSFNEHEKAARTNKYKAARLKKEATGFVYYQLKNVEKPLEGRYYIAFNWICNNEQTDPDNISFAKKYILDALQLRGVIKNDGWRNIAGFIDSFNTGDKDMVEIELKESP